MPADAVEHRLVSSDGLADGHRRQRSGRLDRETFGDPGAAVGCVERHPAPEPHAGKLARFGQEVTVVGDLHARGVGHAERERSEGDAVTHPIVGGTAVGGLGPIGDLDRDDERVQLHDVVYIGVEVADDAGWRGNVAFEDVIRAGHPPIAAPRHPPNVTRGRMPGRYVVAMYAHPQSLADRSVIVTGAAQGVGRGIAQALLERGASVLLVDRSSDGLAATTDEFATAGWPSESIMVDLRDPASPRRIVDAALTKFGRIDALVNNAIATNEPKSLVDIGSDDYDLVFDTGPRATFFLMQAVHPTMAAAGGGVIVNLGSASGTGGQAQFAAYAGAKEAIRGMSKAAALEWGRDNVRVNVVCPFADSPGVQFWSEVAPKDFERALRSVPLGRVGRTREDIGAVVAFLVGDDGTYLTGQTIKVDGGMGVFR